MTLDEYQWPCTYGPPFQHQVKTVKFLLRNTNAFVLSSMGSGKTLACCWAADFLRINGKISRVLVVTPLSTVTAVWATTMWDHLPHRETVPLLGSKEKRLEALKKDAFMYVCNHDAVKTFEAEFIAKKFDLIIIDEFTAYGVHTSQRSRAMQRIAAKAKGVWGLSGSPTANTPLTAYGLAKVTNPKNPRLPKSFYRFRDEVCTTYDGYSWVPKEGHEKRVAEVLSPSIYYRTDECIELPPTIYMDRDVELSSDTNALYKKLKKELLLEFKEGRVTVANAATKCTKLLQVSAGGIIDEGGKTIPLDCKAKIDEIVALYDENGQRPTIISAVFTASVNHLVKELTKRKYKVDYIDGSRTGGARGLTVKAFQEGELDFLILHPKAAAHGLCLTEANLLINFSPIYSNELSEQLHARIIRPGQTRTQLIVNLISTPTEARFFKSLKSKQKMSDVIMAEFTA